MHIWVHGATSKFLGRKEKPLMFTVAHHFLMLAVQYGDTGFKASVRLVWLVVVRGGLHTRPCYVGASVSPVFHAVVVYCLNIFSEVRIHWQAPVAPQGKLGLVIIVWWKSAVHILMEMGGRLGLQIRRIRSYRWISLKDNVWFPLSLLFVNSTVCRLSN